MSDTRRAYPMPLLALAIAMSLSGCGQRVAYIGWSGPIEHPSGIAIELALEGDRPVLRATNQATMAQTITTSSAAYDVMVVSDGKAEHPTSVAMIRRSLDPTPDEFVVLRAGEIRSIPLDMEFTDGVWWVGNLGYALEDGGTYEIHLKIRPFFMSMHASNVDKHLLRLGISNYVTENLNCGTATIQVR
jgi:hypothetical protein